MTFTIIIMAQVVEGKGKLMDNLSNYIIVDIGANLTNKKFSRDLDQVIQRATDSGEVCVCLWGGGRGGEGGYFR